MVGAIMLTDDIFTSVSKDNWKLRRNHVTGIEVHYITTEALLNKG
jgi:hypothetical protein